MVYRRNKTTSEGFSSIFQQIENLNVADKHALLVPLLSELCLAKGVKEAASIEVTGGICISYQVLFLITNANLSC